MSILNKLKEFIEQQKVVNEVAIAKHFGISQGSIEAMLAIFINKELIRKEISNNKVYYCWSDDIVSGSTTFPITMNITNKDNCQTSCNSCKGCK